MITGKSALGEVYGIAGSSYCTIISNTSNRNGYLSGGYMVCGIWASSGGTVTSNTTCNNGDSSTALYVNGIYTNSSCTVTGNTAYSNGTWATGSVYGLCLGAYNLVDQNTSYSNGTNIYTGSGCALGTNCAP